MSFQSSKVDAKWHLFKVLLLELIFEERIDVDRLGYKT